MRKIHIFIGLTALVLTACTAGDAPEKAASDVTVVHNATILTMNENRDMIDNGYIVVSGSEIKALGAGVPETGLYPDAKRIDGQGGIVMPGMVNAHNHLSMVAFRGIAESGIKDLEDRLVNYFFKLEAELLDRELIYVSARHAAIELVMGGVTTTADMYYHEDEVAKAVKEVGIRGVLGQTVIGFPVVDAPQPFGGLNYAEKFITDWQGDPLITPGIAPHAPYTMSPEKLKETKALSDRLGAPILFHMDEIEHEEAMTEEAYPGSVGDKTIVEYLDGLGFLGDRLIAAHVNYVTESDMDILKARGVGISHNPKANTKDMSGLSPAWAMYKKGLDIGLGTDGPMSSNQMDIVNVMPFVIRIARIDHRDVSKFDPEDVIEMATIGGARALDMDDRIGSLEVGKKADLVLFETRSPNMNPHYDPYATLVFSAYPANVDLTMVDGTIIFQDGQLNTVDLDRHFADWSVITQTVKSFLDTMN